MRGPIPVTDSDKLAAVHAYYARTVSLAHIPVPKLGDREAEEILAALGRVLENDRKRVVERTPETSQS